MLWEDPAAPIVPSNALFRHGGDWAVFAVIDGRAVLATAEIGQDNGVQAEVTGGLEEGAEVILYPGAGLADGARVAERRLYPRRERRGHHRRSRPRYRAA